MLSSLTIGNFKAFGPPQKIPIRPITLVFGPNSSGKSSFIHSLLLLHQAAAVDGNLDVHCPRISGNSVDLGGFEEYVHRHNLGRTVSWELEFPTNRLQGRLAELVAKDVQRLSVFIQVGVSQNRDALAPMSKSARLLPAGSASFGEKQRALGAPYVQKYEIRLDNKAVLGLSARLDSFMSVDFLDINCPLVNSCVRACFTGKSRIPGLDDVSDEQLETAAKEMLALLSAKQDLMLPRFVGRKGLEDKEDHLFKSSPEVMFYGGVFTSGRLVGAINEQFVWLIDGLLETGYNAIAHSLGRLEYLGPLRTIPPRDFTTSEAHDANWTSGGAFAWQVIKEDQVLREKVNEWLGHKDRLSTGYRLELRKFFSIEQLRERINQGVAAYGLRSRSSVIQQVAELLGRSSLSTPERDSFLQEISKRNADCATETASVGFDEPKEGSEILEKATAQLKGTDQLMLVDTTTFTEVSHRDVGIGISQVLPVLVAAYASKDHVIAIEQPEIHVHPKLQAELGDVFIEAALSEAGPKNKFILETHSEHLILRILRRIRETSSGSYLDAALASGDASTVENHISITPDDVSVFYILPTQDGARVIELPVTSDGDFAERWPGGFFPERFKELP